MSGMETVYLGGEFVSREKAAVSPLDRGFMFADGVYEVIRSHVDRMVEDRPTYDDLNKLSEVVRKGDILRAVEDAVGPLK